MNVKSQSDRTAVIAEDQGSSVSENKQKKLFGRFQKLSARPVAGKSSTRLT